MASLVRSIFCAKNKLALTLRLSTNILYVGSLNKSHTRPITTSRHESVKHGSFIKYVCCNVHHDKAQVRYNTPGDRWYIVLSAAAGCIAIGIYYGTKSSQCLEVQPGLRRADLPEYTMEEIRQHCSKETGIWVTFGNGVYDITEFLEGHPGGSKILLAAGGPLEPFWELYAVHKNKDVYGILEGLRIGNISTEDMKKATKVPINDPYVNDPSRHPALKVNSKKPFNAETPSQLLVDNLITPNELFFIRNHLPVPKIGASDYMLKCSGDGIKKPLAYSLQDLKTKFKAHTITATIQCAGNRRTHMAKSKPVKGLSWDIGAISNARWTGVLLSDILTKAGVTENTGKHIIFQGGDVDMEKVAYEASIPIETALDPNRQVLLAYEMNDKPLSQDHGFPLRVIVPGIVGARNVKWITNIIVSQQESQSHWQQKDYKTFTPSEDWDTADYNTAVAIQDYPIQSAICEPTDGQMCNEPHINCKGYAWSGGGRGIIRVEVSPDGGKTWHKAKLHQIHQKVNRQWAWTIWEIELPVPKNVKKMEIVCKAIDSSHNQQPETADCIWNIRGLIHNAWHKVTITITDI